MELSLEFLLLKLSEVYNARLLLVPGNRKFTSARLAKTAIERRTSKKAAIDPNIIYVTTDGIIDVYTETDIKGLIWISETRPATDIGCIWIKDIVDENEVLSYLLDIFSFYTEWLNGIKDILVAKKPTEQAVIKLADVVPNPFVYVDSGFRRLAISSDMGLSKVSDTWKYQKKHKDFPVDVLADAMLSGDFDDIVKKRPAWYLRDPKSFDLPLVVRTIFHGDSVYGYIMLVEHKSRINTCDLELVEALGASIETAIAHGTNYEYTTEFPKESVLKAHLIGKEVDHKEIVDMLMLLSWKPDDPYVVMNFMIDSTKALANENLKMQARMLETSLPGRVVVNNGVLSLVHNLNGDTIERILKMTEAFCTRFKWIAGVSNIFNNFDDLNVHYKQAELALSCGIEGDSGSRIHLYHDYLLNSIFDTVKANLHPSFYMHDDIARLINYDKETSSELAQTLEAYLVCDRSIGKTAKQMNLHRNSVLYRVDKIKSIITSDLEDENTRLALLLSLKMTLE